MRLIRDQQAYRGILDDFVAQRLDASGFIHRFRHLWRCDCADGIDGFLAARSANDDQAGLYGFRSTPCAKPMCATCRQAPVIASAKSSSARKWKASWRRCHSRG
jgi:hypothetical protein